MYTLRFTSGYKKSLKKIVRSGNFNLSELNRVVNILSSGEKLASKSKDHSLVGEYAGCRECHIKPDILLIYKIDNQDLILILIDIGSHSSLFG